MSTVVKATLSLAVGTVATAVTIKSGMHFCDACHEVRVKMSNHFNRKK